MILVAVRTLPKRSIRHPPFSAAAISVRLPSQRPVFDSMKILVYNRHFFPNIGGTEISGRVMARELAILGHAVTVVTTTPLPDSIQELDEGYAIVRSEHIATLTRHARASDVVFSRGGVSLRAFVAALCSGVPFVAFHEFDASAGRAGSGVRRYITDAVKALARSHARLHVVVSDADRKSVV